MVITIAWKMKYSLPADIIDSDMGVRTSQGRHLFRKLSSEQMHVMWKNSSDHLLIQMKDL